jgi:hypothetical protein
MSPTTTPTTPLTLAQRVKNGTLLLRQYTAKFAVACIRKQRDSVCPPEEVESLRWLLAALEALTLPSLPPATHPLPIIPLPVGKPKTRTYHLFTAEAQGRRPDVFTEDDKFALLQEAARRYPLLRMPTVPYQLYNGPKVLAGGGCCTVEWDEIVGKPDLVTQVQLMAALSGISSRFTKDVPVSLRNNKTVGKYPNGTIIPAKGLTMQEWLEDIATEDILPTYEPAALAITAEMPLVGEIGEELFGRLSTTFSRNDAGGLRDLALQRKVGGTAYATLATGSATPQTYNLGRLLLRRTLDGELFIGLASYGAGLPKPVPPGGQLDTRPPAVRDPNAPQAGEFDFPSAPLVIRGVYRFFFGSALTAPKLSAEVRALANKPLSSDVSGGFVILETGTQFKFFVCVLPPGITLKQALDLTASSADITKSYRLVALDVEDAQGILHTHNGYVMENDVVYNVSHQHKLFF